VLEAPAGRGKTTTLIQLAELDADKGGFHSSSTYPYGHDQKVKYLTLLLEGGNSYLTVSLPGIWLNSILQSRFLSF